MQPREGRLLSPRANRFILYGILAGVVLGALSGWVFGERMTAVDWIGGFFLDALKMMVVPLVVSSMIVGITGLGDVRRLGRTGATAILYYVATTGLAVLLGIILVNIIHPGSAFEWAGGAMPDAVLGKETTGIIDVFRSLVTPNLIRAAADTQILPLIVFSLLFGAVLTTIGEKGRPVIRFFDGVNEAILKIVLLVLFIAPVGVFALVASRLGQAGGGGAFVAEVSKIGLYALTVIVGLFLHGAVTLPLILFFVARRNPWRYLCDVAPAVGTAFSTASSSATLPVTIECCENRGGLSKRSSYFILPLGATINMDGTALYESVAAIFIAQAVGHPLSAANQVVIFLTATLASIGAAGIPQAGLVTMVIVLRAVGLPLEGIGMILAIDWFLDRCRTAVNVWGDTVGAAVLDRIDPVCEGAPGEFESPR
ncbi:MAG: dicarboxylate/amino acid:cation symporter [Candidatus Eisenbacteria bacterium]|nr:dicarboxylate/amino acid:cation symporter [Candidatus Eisenbacteria bacterium]